MKFTNLFIVFIATLCLNSCKKFLAAKPDITLSTPSTLQDFQALLDLYSLNTQFPNSTEIMADNYYLTFANWNSIRNETQKDYYIWAATDQNNLEWNQAYTNIYTCNLILENLKSIDYPVSEKEKASSIKGSALFFRASYSPIVC